MTYEEVKHLLEMRCRLIFLCEQGVSDLPKVLPIVLYFFIVLFLFSE